MQCWQESDFTDTLDMDKIVESELKLTKAGDPLVTERFDLMKVQNPCLMVGGLEHWMDKDILQQHFEEMTQAKIEFIEIQDGGRAKIMFINPQGNLQKLSACAY